jgi:hypothetical protein
MNTTTVIDTPERIAMFHLLQLKYALKLESVGLRHSSGRSVAAYIRKQFGLKARNKQQLLNEFAAYINTYSESNGS